MSTAPNIARIERSDDIPLLLAQMEKMEVAALLDKHFPTHGNWQGLSLGQLVVVWLAYILSEGDHRLNSVQGWAAGRLMTLDICLKTIGLRELDFSDDRLCMVLNCLGQNTTTIRVYNMKARRIRIDSTTAKSYVAVTEDGLFQFGHSKEHRPDLPQLKINMVVLDPLGMPLSLSISVQMPIAALRVLLEPVWAGTQVLDPVHRAPETALDKPEHIANGYAYSVTLKEEHGGESIEWQEQRLVVQSLKHAIAQKKALDARLEKAKQAIEDLNKQGRGRKRLDEEGLRMAVESILKRYNLVGLLAVEYCVQTKTTRKRAYLMRPAHEVTVVTVTVSTSCDATAYENTVRCMGWRVYICNDTELGLGEAVLAYREEYIVERGFNRFRGDMLGLTPLFLTSTTCIKGLVRLLSIVLRVVCLVEFTVRKALQEQNEKLDGIYAGNPKRATARPTTEMMLRAFVGISLAVVSSGGIDHHRVSPLNAVQSRILALLGSSTAIYQGLALQFMEADTKMGEP